MDLQLFKWFYGWLHQPAWLPVWGWVTHLGDAKVVLILVMLGVIETIVIRVKKRSPIPLVAPWLGVLAAGSVAEVLKRWVDRPRPGQLEHLMGLVVTDPGRSFPSGHATAIFALATALSFRWPKGWAVWFGVAVLVALSRLALGVHWPSDLVAGVLIGSGTVIGLAWFESRISHIKEG